MICDRQGLQPIRTRAHNRIYGRASQLTFTPLQHRLCPCSRPFASALSRGSSAKAGVAVAFLAARSTTLRRQKAAMEV
eukprot:scaffold301_cov243-Pinguiococcus_pyrenoidosus.AAC.70